MPLVALSLNVFPEASGTNPANVLVRQWIDFSKFSIGLRGFTNYSDIFRGYLARTLCNSCDSLSKACRKCMLLLFSRSSPRQIVESVVLFISIFMICCVNWGGFIPDERFQDQRSNKCSFFFTIFTESYAKVLNFLTLRYWINWSHMLELAVRTFINNSPKTSQVRNFIVAAVATKRFPSFLLKFNFSKCRIVLSHFVRSLTANNLIRFVQVLVHLHGPIVPQKIGGY